MKPFRRKQKQKLLDKLTPVEDKESMETFTEADRSQSGGTHKNAVTPQVIN